MFAAVGDDSLAPHYRSVWDHPAFVPCTGRWRGAGLPFGGGKVSQVPPISYILLLTFWGWYDRRRGGHAGHILWWKHEWANTSTAWWSYRYALWCTVARREPVCKTSVLPNRIPPQWREHLGCLAFHFSRLLILRWHSVGFVSSLIAMRVSMQHVALARVISYTAGCTDSILQ